MFYRKETVIIVVHYGYNKDSGSLPTSVDTNVEEESIAVPFRKRWRPRGVICFRVILYSGQSTGMYRWGFLQCFYYSLMHMQKSTGRTILVDEYCELYYR